MNEQRFAVETESTLDKKLINISVVFLGNYRLITGEAKVEIDLPAETTISDLLNILVNRYGDELRDHLIEPGTGKMWTLMALAINGEIISSSEKFSRCLQEGDEVVFLPPAFGG